MSRVSGRINWGLLVAAFAGLVLFAATLMAAPPARAGDDPEPWKDDAAHWLCRPGDTPDPCAGSLEGKRITPEIPPPGQTLGYRVNSAPKVDCFYVYPTQSEQTTANANWTKDPELLRPTINQAEQFSRQCRVFAPMYRQYTLWALKDMSRVTDEVRDLAYGDLVAAWNTYLARYNKGRGVIVIGHSQGTSHMARLMASLVDNNPKVRSRIIGAYLIGGNVYVPKGKKVGGQFKHMPACSSGTETGCIVAYSAFEGEPAMDSPFGRIESGYWVNPNPRPDPDLYEVMCVNPAGFNGDDGYDRTMVNTPAFLSPGNPQPAAPWKQHDGFYRSGCRNQNDASWLQVDPVPDTSSPELAMLLDQVGGGKDGLHLADVNIALDNLVALAGTQSAAWLKTDARRKSLAAKRASLERALKKLKRKAAAAVTKCHRTKPRAAKRKACGQSKQLRAAVRKTVRKLASVEKELARLG